MGLYWNLIRGKNLVIVGLTQILLQLLVVIPYLNDINREPVLDKFHFALLVFVTVVIAGSGYIINDYYDVEIDSVNKPDGLIISKLISKSKSLRIYWLLVISGMCVSIYLANFVGRISWFMIYPFSIYLLFEYARFFKKTTLVGNLIVALFSASVAGIVLFPEATLNFKISDVRYDTFQMTAIFFGYIFFAFCSTMYREIVKDIEDINGDRQFGAKTLPIVWGIRNAKLFASIWGLLLGVIFSGLLYILIVKNHLFLSVLGALAVMLPLLLSFYKIAKAVHPHEFHAISQIIKIMMVGGLVFLIFLVQIF